MNAEETCFICLSRREIRTLLHFLDRLCEHEESVIESHTVNGEIMRNDKRDARVVMQSRRVFRTAQQLITMIEDEVFLEENRVEGTAAAGGVA